MTDAARNVLKECELALADFEAGADTVHWRSRFVALITALRSVGLVLKLKDYPASSDTAKEAIDQAWERLKSSKSEPRIFHKFIDAERYNVAHLYDVNAGVNITARPGSLWVNLATGESGSEPSGPTTYEYFMRYGPFQGQDPVKLCREAIAFWREYLDDIEQVIESVNRKATL